MVKKIVKTYTEVEIAGTEFERSYRNPLTKAFQYEYALYEVVSGLFGRVECRSMNIENLRMYFLELPVKDQDEHSAPEAQKDEAAPKRTPKMNREKMKKEMEALVAEKVRGEVLFPMMDRCAAEVSTVPAEDGTHWLVFTDGIYGFALHLEFGRKGKLTGIEVRDFNQKMKPVEPDGKSGKMNSEHKKSVRPEVA
jgi:hypothetical protein